MNKIERVYYNHGKNYEEFELLYLSNDKKYVLVKNLSTKNNNKYSFGLYSDLHSIYSFPVNQSCLYKTQCIKRIRQFIKIDKEYSNMLPHIKENIKMYKDMINILKLERMC